MKSYKEKWIKAYEITMEEYANGTHNASIHQCTKCKLANYYDGETCYFCPESVFGGSFGCLNRNNDAITVCENVDPKKINRLVEYHKQAIELLKTIPTRKFQPKNFNPKTFIGLVQIEEHLKQSNMILHNLTIDDLKKAFNAGRNIIQQSDDDVQLQYNTFEEWLQEYYDITTPKQYPKILSYKDMETLAEEIKTTIEAKGMEIHSSFEFLTRMEKVLYETINMHDNDD